MKVVIGRFYRKTPVFSADLTTLEFNPYWYIPPNIMRNDIFPKIRNDPSFIINNNIWVFEDGFRADPRLIDWQKVDENSNSYKFVQLPGINNPMGRVKFLFPNKYKVYMHDTPDKKLFESASPSFSSGCIRLSKAIELAKYLLKNDKNWGPELIDSLISKKKTVTITLSKPLKVYLQYFTVWVNEDGTLQFVPDIYKRDR
jgi:murein L,D-transpeptidase YcbB/YkuD